MFFDFLLSVIWFELIYVLTVLCLCIYFFFFAVVSAAYFIKKENVNQCVIHEQKIKPKWVGCQELKIWDVYCLTVIKK